MEYSTSMLRGLDLPVPDPTYAISSSMLISNIADWPIGLDTYIPIIHIDHTGIRRYPSSPCMLDH